MFKQLRNRLLIMNLTMISVLIAIMFTTIYLITYNNIQDDITSDLNRIASFRVSQMEKPLPTTGDIPAKDVPPESKNLEPPPSSPSQTEDVGIPERMISFVIEINLSDDTEKIISNFLAEDSFYDKALQEAISGEQPQDHFELDGSTWSYSVHARDNIVSYAFIDSTSQMAVLTRMIKTFVFVYILSFVMMFFISRYLTNRSIAPIAEAFDKQKQFISDASHELKTPLAVIGTNVDVLLENQTFKNSADYKWLIYIKDEVTRMSHLTKDLLYLTQMEYDDDHHMMRNNFNISERIENMLLGMEVVAFEKNIHLFYSLEPSIECHGNSEQLTQVAMILLDNAIKYTPEGGHVQLTLKQSTHHIIIKVTNTGIGISQEDLSHIFDRFYRVDSSRSRASDSYGLGLPIAKAIVEQHGGKITCESQLDKDTVFTVKIKKI